MDERQILRREALIESWGVWNREKVDMDEFLRKAKVVFAWCLLIGCLIGWPSSLLWLAATEPPFVLSLSWLALIIESITLITSAQVRRDQSDESNESDDEATG